VHRDEKVAKLPSHRMKRPRPFVLPLSAPALTIIEEVRKLRTAFNPYVFAGPTGRRISDTSCSNLLQATIPGVPLILHGCARSSFRDWAAENGVPDDVAEACLAHVEGNKTVAAYKRTSFLEARRRVMDDWAAYLNALNSQLTNYNCINKLAR
jgi:integrase